VGRDGEEEWGGGEERGERMRSEYGGDRGMKEAGGRCGVRGEE